MLQLLTTLDSLLDNPLIAILAILVFNSVTNIVTSILSIILSRNKIQPETLKQFKEILENSKIELIK